MHVITTVGAPRVGACGMTGRPATGGHMAYQLGRPHDIRNRSRDATASEFRIRHSENLPNEGRRSADRRTLHDRATLSDVAICECFGRGRGLIGDRSPLGAPPRRLPRKLMPWLSPGRVSWDVRQSGRYPTAAVPVQRGTSRTGRNAGRLDTRTARERGYKPRPQEPHPPHQSAVTGDVPRWAR